MNPEISLGTVAVAKRATAICFLGEIGICYKVHDLEGNAAYGFIFETGRSGIFSQDDVNLVLRLSGRVCDAVVDYKFTDVRQLSTDFRAGRFKTAFPRSQTDLTDEQVREAEKAEMRRSLPPPHIDSLKMPSTQKH
jgi:hypothetical protein